MTRISLTILLCCVAVVCTARATEDAELRAAAAVISEYRDQWAASEADANTPERRVTLSRMLVKYANERVQTQPDLALYAARKAHTYGRMQRPSFGDAAAALALVQRLDPDAKLEALESVSELYRAAYEENPSVRLGMGVGYADALALVARERQRRFEQEVEVGDLTTRDMYQTANLIHRDWSNARRTIARVLNSAQRIASRLDESDTERLILIKAFIAKQEQAMQRYGEQVEAVSNYRDGIALVARVERTDSPDEQLRRDAAWQYLCVMGRPDKAKPYADAILPEPERAMLDIALADDRLEPHQSVELAGWYVALSQRCPNPLGQRRSLERAVRQLRSVDGQLPNDPAKVRQAQDVAKQVQKRGEALALRVDLDAITPRTASSLKLDPEPTSSVAIADPEPETQERATPRPTPTTAIDPDHDADPTPTATRRPSAASSGRTSAATPSWLEAEEDGDYFDAREKSIFDFGRE